MPPSSFWPGFTITDAAAGTHHPSHRRGVVGLPGGRSDKPVSVHLAEFPEPDPRWDDQDRAARWNDLLVLREQVLVALEGLRKNKANRKRQEAKVADHDQSPGALAAASGELLATLCIVSEVEIVADRGRDRAHRG